MTHDVIVVRGAREHNLKNIDLTLPRDQLIVVTGVSGSGKSTLAFDTIYAEGQRRYVESLSAYARQFLGLMEKPDVDHIEGLSPAISIDQKGTSRNPRSTVGTVTEIYDYLRLLYARVGIVHCPKCGRVIAKQSIDQIVELVLGMGEGTRLMIAAPVVQGRKGEHKDVLQSARASGYARARIDGSMYDLADTIDLDKNLRHSIDIIIDRIAVDAAERSRLADSLEQASQLGRGVVRLISPEGDTEDQLLSLSYGCPICGITVEEPQPRHFSFNSPFGACPDCTGLGLSMEIDPEALIADPALSLEEGVLSKWLPGGPMSFWLADTVKYWAAILDIPQDVPWEKLPGEQQKALLYGGEAVVRKRRHGWHAASTAEGIIPYLENRYRTSESDWVKEEITKLMMQKPCPSCNGERLKPEYRAVTVGSLGIMSLTRLSIADALHWVEHLVLDDREELIAHNIRKELLERLGFLNAVGLDYLTLDRSATTLSGGEAQRIRLATQIGSKLMGVLYVLDEPSIGLHQRDNHKLIETLQMLRDLGNTLIVVEHDEETMRASDYIVDMGPGAGRHGGEIVVAGTIDDVMCHPGSLTGQYLRGDRTIPVPRERRKGNGNALIIRNASANNLKHIDVEIPLGCFVGIAGVSGSGKSTLINDILYASLAKILNRARTKPGVHGDIEGVEFIDKVINVDQSPIGRTPRSNPATYVGVFTDIRDLFARLPEAKIRGYKPGRFSFNVKGGRCEACQGDGVIKIEMHFLPDIYVPCEVCQGKRYNHEALQVQFQGHTIADVLALTIDEALSLFAHQPKIVRKLKTISEVGLGYITLGQAATQLSGGEAQRVKLSSELSRRDTGRTVYILDEPTTGLHFADVDKLLVVLHRLVDAGNTVIVIEHNLDVLKTADHLIELGPAGGDKGGTVIATGTPEELLDNPASVTGPYLRDLVLRSVHV